jgi:hypothetical protein
VTSSQTSAGSKSQQAKAAGQSTSGEKASGFVGVQVLLMKGLLSQVTERNTVQLLSQLAVIPYNAACNSIFHPSSTRFLANLVCVYYYNNIFTYNY